MDRRRRYISRLPGILGLQALIRLSGQKLVFPFYHVVSDLALPHISGLYSYRDEAGFLTDLEELLGVFEPVSMEEALRPGHGKGGRPRMLLSFDDGLKECYSIVAPVLLRKGIPAAFFINNDFVDNRGLFYRFRIALLLDALNRWPERLARVAGFLELEEAGCRDAILKIRHGQDALLEALAGLLDLDYGAWLNEHRPYMSTAQIRSLRDQGFSIGAHSASHPDFSALSPEEMVDQVRLSLDRLQADFDLPHRCFAFPFSSDGVPAAIIDRLLDDGIAEALFGTSGLKLTGRRNFHQRIPMEVKDLSARSILRTEYRYFLLKAALGKNQLR